MKKNVLIAILLLPFLAWAQTKPTAPLPPDESKARLQQLGNSLKKYDYFGYFNRNCQMVIQIATKDKGLYTYRYGLIDDKGEILLSCMYDDIRFVEHSDLIMVAENNVSAGFMNRQLQWVIPPKYRNERWRLPQWSNLFEHGMVVVTDSADNYGVVDSLGHEILLCQYDLVEIAEPDLFLIKKVDSWGAVNRHGETVIPFVYKYLRYLGDHYLEAEEQSLYGVISTNGEEILPIVYEQICDYANGLFAVQQNGKWGVVDSVGNVIIPFIHEAPHLWFISSMDLIEVGSLQGIMDRDDPAKRKLLNKNGEVLVQSYDVSIPGESGERIAVLVYNKDGVVTCDIFDRFGRKLESYEDIIFEGIDREREINMIPIKRNGKWGFVNRDFHLIVPCQYEGNPHGGYCHGIVTTADQQTLLIDEKGEVLVKGPYKWISPSVNGWFQVAASSPNSWKGIRGFIDRYGNTTFTEEELRLIQKWHEEQMK